MKPAALYASEGGTRPASASSGTGKPGLSPEGKRRRRDAIQETWPPASDVTGGSGDRRQGLAGNFAPLNFAPNEKRAVDKDRRPGVRMRPARHSTPQRGSENETKAALEINWMFSTDKARTKMARAYPNPSLKKS